MPPNPAARAEGRFAVMSTNSAVFYGEFEMRLWGGKPTDKAILMHRAVAIGLAKFESAGSRDFDVTGQGAFVMSGAISENLMANEISVSLRAQVNPSRSRINQSNSSGTGTGIFSLGGIGIAINAINAVANAAKDKPTPQRLTINTTNTLAWLKVPAIWDDGTGGRFDPGSRGTAQLLLTAAALQDPCLRKTVNTVAGQAPNDKSLQSGDTPSQITISSTQPDDKQALRSTTESGMYTRYMVDQKTELNTNTFQMPVASPNEKPAIIQTGEAVASRRVEWSAEKVGSPPYVPNPKSNDPNMVLTKAQIAPQELGLAADGVSPIYRVKGCYDYVFLDPTKAYMTAALPPWMSGFASILRSSPFAFAHGIIDQVSGGALMKSVGAMVGGLVAGGGGGGNGNAGLSASDNGQPRLSTGGGSIGAGGGNYSFGSSDGGFTDR
jgi:hypothetical protein